MCGRLVAPLGVKLLSASAVLTVGCPWLAAGMSVTVWCCEVVVRVHCCQMSWV